jgi:tRNA (guanine-N7-)-methyltransferase
MRLRNVKNADEILSSRKDIFIENPYAFKGIWKQVFKNDNPIYLEIGMGKGQFIYKNALVNPDINFIGLELEKSVLTKAVNKIETIDNLYIINYDAANIKDVFADNEVDRIYLNFSDPWPKNRHSKRRLTQNTFLENYREILTKDGLIAFKTDNRHLFEFSLQELNNTNWKFEKISLNLHEDFDDIITTEYEDKFIKENKIIYFVEVKNGKNETI